MLTQDQISQWGTNPRVPYALRQQFLTKKEDPKWLADAFGSNIDFGTAGMRGMLEPGTNRINLFTVGRVTEGLARLMMDAGQDAVKRGVVISFDSRYHSAEFAQHSAEILGHHGIKVYLFDSLRPTPELSFATRYLKTYAGIMITASHNAKQYNGYKIYGEDGAQMPPEAAEKVVKYADQVDFFSVETTPLSQLRRTNLVQMVGEDVDRAYLERLKTVNVNHDLIAKTADQLKIVYTPLHGTGKVLYARAFAQGGFKNIIPVVSQTILDPEFSTTVKPNPEFHQVFDEGIKIAKREKASFIVATDPDADRMGVCVRDQNDDFQVLTGNQIAALMMNYLLVNLKAEGKLNSSYEVITSIVSSALPFKIARHYGVKTKYVLTGFKYIGEEIDWLQKENDGNFLMGFEESYGYLFKTFNRDKDAMQGALMLAEVAAYYASRQMTLFDGLQEIWKQYGATCEITRAIEMPGIGGQKKMAAIMKKLRQEHLSTISGCEVVEIQDFLSKTCTKNGQNSPLNGFPVANVLKYQLRDQTWVALRPSGTEPVIKAYVGATEKTYEKARQKALQYQEALNQLIQG